MSGRHAVPARVVRIRERETSFVALAPVQARALQQLGFCNVTPTNDPDTWRVSDVARIGVAALPGLRFEVVPKAPLRSLVFMASFGGRQLVPDAEDFEYGADATVPTALASALAIGVERAISRGLVKGYRSTSETAYVVRGRWDVTAQLQRRPGIPLPVEITFDDFTEDVLENRVLRAALRRTLRFEGLEDSLRQRLVAQLNAFIDVGDLPYGIPTPELHITRLNAHYAPALDIARWILEATSWAHERGAARGSTFLVNMADIFERFVGEALRAAADRRGLAIHLQQRDWVLDAGGHVQLRPDIVLARANRAVTVADTKYKVWGQSSGSPPNADVYQALAYALTAGVDEAHLVYVSGDVEPRAYDIRSAGKRVFAHAIDLGGGPRELIAAVEQLAERMLIAGEGARSIGQQ